MDGSAPGGGAGECTERQGEDCGEWPSESLRRMIDDIRSGRIETTDYPSAKEYLEHLDNMPADDE